eukprot:Tamp_17985.p1 GENE.Tamp_17985~~Tamp_17985.p1  ORF type:complete len:242 (-),score=76.15 Tamp_17985:630-1283(-)
MAHGDGEYSACLENIKELDRLADSLQSLGTQLHKADGSNQSLIRRAEDETENGRVLSQETGQYLKSKLEDRNVQGQSRAQLERLGREFQAAGSKFESVSRRVLEQLRRANEAEEAGADIEVGGQGAREAAGRRSQVSLDMEQPLLDDSHMQHAMHNALQRNGELRQLEADLGDLHTLFKDVATLAQLQQVSMPLRPTPAAQLLPPRASAAASEADAA